MSTSREILHCEAEGCENTYAIEDSDAQAASRYCSSECEEASTINVLARVEAAMQTDTDNAARNSERIAAIYTAAPPETQRVVDAIFVALCGWQLGTILAGEDRDDDERED